MGQSERAIKINQSADVSGLEWSGGGLMRIWRRTPGCLARRPTHPHTHTRTNTQLIPGPVNMTDDIVRQPTRKQHSHTYTQSYKIRDACHCPASGFPLFPSVVHIITSTLFVERLCYWYTIHYFRFQTNRYWTFCSKAIVTAFFVHSNLFQQLHWQTTKR